MHYEKTVTNNSNELSKSLSNTVTALQSYNFGCLLSVVVRSARGWRQLCSILPAIGRCVRCHDTSSAHAVRPSEPKNNID